LTETHIPGDAIVVSGRFMRQRCAWCGKTLLDYDLTRVATPVAPGEQPQPGKHPTGELVRFDGGVSYPIDTADLSRGACGHTLTPEDSCTRLDPAVTR
jgi:hypothetical protein